MVAATAVAAAPGPPALVPAHGSDSDPDRDAGGEAAAASRSLIIPIADSGLFVEIFPEELAETPVATLLKVLQAERAGLDLFAEAGAAYMQVKQPREALALLEEACQRLTRPEHDALPSGARARLLSAAGIAQLATAGAGAATAGGGAGAAPAAGASSALQAAMGQVRQDAEKKIHQAEKLDQLCPMLWVGKSIFFLSNGDYDNARSLFQTTLSHFKQQCLPALLGLAAVQYGRGQFREAQQSYAEAIRLSAAWYDATPLGASVRVGFGLACYRLGQVDRARAAFARALDMDPACVPAMVGTAVLDLAAADRQDSGATTERAIKLMSEAHLLDQSNAMVQNHLANHYFWKWAPLPGTARVERGSTLVHMSQPMPGLEPGERIRIGDQFETTIVEDASAQMMEEDDNDDDGNEGLAGTVFRIQHPWKGESNEDLNVAKKDYDRVIALAKGAHGSTSVREIQAESYFFLARVYHVREENEAAFKCYERACKFSPRLAPARYGLAQTLVVKGEFKEAKHQLQRLIEENGNATDSLALLGLLEVKAGGANNLEQGLAHLAKASELDPYNPDFLILEALALRQHRSTYAKAADKLRKAIDLIKRKGESVPYEVYVNRGVLCASLNRHDEALQMYTFALHALDPTGELCQYTVETPPFIRQDANFMFCDYVDSNIKVQATVIKVVAGEDDTESHDADQEASLATVLQVMNASSAEFSALSVQEGDSVRVGDTLVSTVIKIEEEDGNVSIKLKDALETTDESLPLCIKHENQILNVPEAITIAFNIARLHEGTGRTLAAIEIHKAILKRNPAYFPSTLRLACISVDCGSLQEGAEWLKISAAIEKTPEVLTLIGNLHLSLCDWAAAQPIFDDLLAKKVPKVDAYARLSLGTIYFSTLFVNPARYSKHLTYASDYYKHVISKDPANAYAANGLGAILAEKGEIYKAKEIFNRVREVSGDTIADALLNLGHVFLATKKHPEALQMYQSYMKRAENIRTPVTSKSRKDDVVDTLLYISFAYFDWAQHTELSENPALADGRYKKAMEHLELAIAKHTKKEIVLMYNLAKTKMHAANCILHKPSRNIPRTVEEIQEALVGLRESLEVVKTMLDEKTEKKIPISSSILERFISQCEANIREAEAHLEDEKYRTVQADRERSLRLAVAEAAMKEEEYRKALAREKELEEQAERDRKAERAMAKVNALRENWQQEKARSEQAKDKKAKKAAMDLQEGLDLQVEEGQSGKGLFDDSSDDESEQGDQDAEHQNRQRDLFADSSDEEKEPAKESSASSDKPHTSKDLFGDSSDEDGSVNDSSKPEGDARPNARDLFGDSDDESEEDNIPDGGKRKNEGVDLEQPSKKQRVQDDSDDNGTE